jgi:hypothetical protein
MAENYTVPKFGVDLSRGFDRVFPFDSDVHQRYHVRRSSVIKFLYENFLQKSNIMLRGGKNRNVHIVIIYAGGDENAYHTTHNCSLLTHDCK